MIYADMAIAEAEGAILAHSQFAGTKKLKKGHVIGTADITALKEAGVSSVSAYRLEDGDIGEDDAANRLATSCAGEHLETSAAFTGRCNLYAKQAGLVVFDKTVVDRVNLVDEALTVATLPLYEPVETGRMVATIKIIPFAVPESALTSAVESLGGTPLLNVHPWLGLKAGLIETQIPGNKRGTSGKFEQITTGRLDSIGASLSLSSECDHTVEAVAAEIQNQLIAGCNLILIAGASAVTDRRDVIPAAIEAAGGEIDHFGMPVDPGNLLLLGHLGDVPIIGLPGCARSPKFNGFDWVLHRLGAGLPVTSEDIMRMGAGGLLKEIGSRPLPRRQATGQPSKKPGAPKVAALVLAAGTSSRMGDRNKLLELVSGQPMVRHAVEAAVNSKASPIVVVTGNQQTDVETAINGTEATTTHNPDFSSGMASSLKVGLQELPEGANAVVVCLGDMPLVTVDHINKLIAAYDEEEGRTICVPTFEGKWGNPILWSRRYFAEMQAISGDKGARELLHAHADEVCEVPMDDDGILRDFDTPEALKSL